MKVNTLVGCSVLEDVYSISGGLLLKKDTILTTKHLQMLNKYNLLNPIRIKEMLDQKPICLSKEQYLETVKYMREVFRSASTHKLPPLDELRDFLTPMIESAMNQHSLLPIIHDLRDVDATTYEHSVNVGLIAAVIGKIIGLDESKMAFLGELGIFHDIGKALIDPNILNKKGKLTPEERKIMEGHSILGYNLLKSQLKNQSEELLNSALLHHEKLDGTGYPLSLKSEGIPWYIQIVTVADTYDAIVKRRCYKSKKTPFFAACEMRSEAFNNKLNPQIVFPFFNYILRQYLHSKVRLNDGREGTIVFVFYDSPHCPLVKVDGQIIDLRKQQKLQIVEIIPIE